MSTLDAIPYLGSGLGFRRSLKRETIEKKEDIDFVEVISDNFLEKDSSREVLREVCDHFTTIPHGVGLSVGSADGIDDVYLSKIREVSEITGSPYYSEHLCHTRAPGIDIENLSPLWFTEETLQCTTDNVNKVQEALGKPLVLENVSYLFDIPSAGMSQVDFFNRLVHATGCGVLVDVTNVFVNSINHKCSPTSFLEALPLDHVVQVHLAGGHWDGKLFLDSHTKPVQEGSWELLVEIAKRAPLKGAILEQDGDYPANFSVLTDQVARARATIEANRYAGDGRTGGVPSL